MNGAGDGMPHGPSRLVLPCVSLGSASRYDGQSYGVLHLSRGLQLSGQERARLDDFALSLYGWAQVQRADFSTFFRLDADSRWYLLARASHFGRKGRGPVAIAHGVLLDDAAIAWMNQRVYRLIGQIPLPLEEKLWTADTIAVDRGLVDAKLLSLMGLTELARAVSSTARTTLIETVGIEPEPALQQLLEQAPLHVRETPLTWSSTDGLTASGRHDPAARALILRFEGDRARGATPADHRMADGVALTTAQLPPAFAPWCAMFERFDDPDRLPVDATARRHFGRVKWPTRYADLSLEAAVDATLQRMLDTGQAIAPEVLWQVLAEVAAGARTIADPADREAAARGMLTTLDRMLGDDPAVASVLLRDFLEQVELPGADDALEALVLRRDALAWLGPGIVQLLGDRAGPALQAAVRAGLRGDTIKLRTARPLLRWLARNAGPSGEPALLGDAIHYAERQSAEDVRNLAVAAGTRLLDPAATSRDNIDALWDAGPALVRMSDGDEARYETLRDALWSRLAGVRGLDRLSLVALNAAEVAVRTALDLIAKREGKSRGA